MYSSDFIANMTHNEQRAHWVKEGFIGLGIGVLFGATNVAVGHVRSLKKLYL